MQPGQIVSVNVPSNSIKLGGIQKFYHNKIGRVISNDGTNKWPIVVRFKKGIKPLRECRFNLSELKIEENRRKNVRRIINRRGD